MKFRKQLAALLLLSFTVILLCGCSAEQETSSQEELTAQTAYLSLKDLEGKRIGVQIGTRFDEIACKYIDGAQIDYFTDGLDCPLALNAGKIDAYIVDEPIARNILLEYPEHLQLATLEDDQYGFIFPKTEQGAALRDQFNRFLADSKENGIFAEVDRIWFGSNESRKVVDTDSLTGENGTLQFVTEASTPPFSYMKDGRIVGYEVDLAARFCKEHGYALEVTNITFAGLLASIASRKSDFGAGCISITEERKQTMNFSDVDYTGGIVVIVNGNDPEESESSGGIAESFEKTFLREDRWKLFISGIGVTLLITALSSVFGTGIGFLLYLAYRKNRKIFNRVLNVFMDILEKTPVVVLLMILYYIIFGNSDLKGMWVAVIGFSILFACGFVRTVDGGVKAVDIGQTEAALALGFTDARTFLLVILPQAAKHFLPNYRGNIVSLLKDTAIVGYIAVQDLTKVGDIVRSRTYEAFFPLIATAVIYFLLAWLLAAIVGHIEFRFDPKNRSAGKILKGVQTK